MTESVKEAAESAIELSTNDSLNELKQSIIKETIDEMVDDDSGLFPDTKKRLLKRYLKKQGKFLEFFEGFLIKSFFRKNISSELKQFKEDIYKAKTTEELNTIKDSFLSKIETKDSSTGTAKTRFAGLLTGNTLKKHKEKKNAESSKEHYYIDDFDINIPKKYEDLYSNLKGPELPDLEPFACAMKGYDEMKDTLKNPEYLTVVDFTKPNDKNRFYVINMTTNTIEYATTVGHGSGSGKGKFAESFSNRNGSYQSSLGFYRVPDNIEKKKRWSGLLMNGIEGSNNEAGSRGIYMHPGGLISQGCFTLPKDKAMEIMNKVKGDSLLFAYAKSKDYFSQSNYFDTDSTGDVLAA